MADFIFKISPNIVLVIAIILSQLALFLRLNFMRKLLGFNIRIFITKVYARILIVSFLSAFVPIIVHKQMEPNFVGLIFTSTVCILVTLLTIYLFGCNKTERNVVHVSLKKIKNKFL